MLSKNQSKGTKNIVIVNPHDHCHDVCVIPWICYKRLQIFPEGTHSFSSYLQLRGQSKSAHHPFIVWFSHMVQLLWAFPVPELTFHCAFDTTSAPWTLSPNPYLPLFSQVLNQVSPWKICLPNLWTQKGTTQSQHSLSYPALSVSLR